MWLFCFIRKSRSSWSEKNLKQIFKNFWKVWIFWIFYWFRGLFINLYRNITTISCIRNLSLFLGHHGYFLEGARQENTWHGQTKCQPCRLCAQLWSHRCKNTQPDYSFCFSGPWESFRQSTSYAHMGSPEKQRSTGGIDRMGTTNSVLTAAEKCREFPVPASVHQGSALFLLLFIIVMNVITKKPAKTSNMDHAYADDDMLVS